MRWRILFVLLPWLAGSCNGALNSLKHGNYPSAIKWSAQRLQRKPDDARARQILVAAYGKAYDQHQAAIQRLSRSEEMFRWERVLKEYEQLQALGRRIRECKACTGLVGAFPTAFDDRIRETRELAAAERYDYAEQAFAQRETDRQAAREAVLNYQKAEEWVSGYREAGTRAADAMYFATLRVVVEPLSLTPELSMSETEDFQRQIYRQLTTRITPSRFVRFYLPGVTPEPGRSPDQVVQMAVTDYDAASERITSSSQTVESDKEYKVGEKKINDSTKVDVLAKVKGTLTTYRKTIEADLDLRIRAVDLASGEVVWEDLLSDGETWTDEWYSFTGDERALNGKSLTTSPNPSSPSAWQLLDKMLSSLAWDVGWKLNRMYQE